MLFLEPIVRAWRRLTAPRPSAPRAALRLEVLEGRALLSASPVSSSLGGHAQPEHQREVEVQQQMQIEHQRPEAQQQVEVEHQRPETEHQGPHH